MKKFTYIIVNPGGMNACIASQLAKTATALDSAIAVHKIGGSSAGATNLMALMGIGIGQGDTVEVTVGFGEEEANTAVMQRFFQDNL